MATPTPPEMSYLVIGLMYNDPNLKHEIIKKLSEKFGKVLLKSDEFDFEFTNYYKEEMGNSLKKIFILFDYVVTNDLPQIKLYTNSLECKENDPRKINIDPGYLNTSQLIVASCKSRYNRIYLDKGIYAHLMFVFKKNDLLVFKWTYEDYIAQKDFFLKCRKLLNNESKKNN